MVPAAVAHVLDFESGTWWRVDDEETSALQHGPASGTADHGAQNSDKGDNQATVCTWQDALWMVTCMQYTKVNDSNMLIIVGWTWSRQGAGSGPGQAQGGGGDRPCREGQCGACRQQRTCSPRQHDPQQQRLHAGVPPQGV